MIINIDDNLPTEGSYSCGTGVGGSKSGIGAGAGVSGGCKVWKKYTLHNSIAFLLRKNLI